MRSAERKRLAERVRAIRIFDPAVGSGAFLFECLTSLRTALDKLEPDAAEPTPEIIKSQLHGQDIHALAAQITRLRLFIALKAADRKANRAAPLGYAWWAAFGDGFDVNEREVTTLAVPDAWAADPAEAVALGQRLIDAMPQCAVETLMRGTVWRNVDFHTHAPDLIEEIDRLYVEALRLPMEPLLTHLRIIRSNRSWDFGERW